MNFAGFTPMDCAGFTQKELRCQDKKAARAWGQILGLEEEMQGLPLPHLPLPHCVTLESSFPLPALHLPTQTSPALSWVVLYARAKLATLPRGNVIWPTQKGIHSAQELACALSTTESTFIATAPPAKPWPAATILTKLHCTDQAYRLETASCSMGPGKQSAGNSKNQIHLGRMKYSVSFFMKQ